MRKNVRILHNDYIQISAEYEITSSKVDNAKKVLESCGHATDVHDSTTVSEMESSIARIDELVKNLESLAHENPGLEDTIQKYEEARNAKFAELEQLKSAIEAAKLDLRDAENAHDTAKKAKENFELQEDYNRVLLFSWTVCAGGVDQLGKWSHEYPCEFELLCNAAKAMMTTTPSSNSGFTSQK